LSDKILIAMILVVDIGNSNIVFGVADGQKWIKTGRIQTDWTQTADEYEITFSSRFDRWGINVGQITRTVLSSVVPSLNRPFDEMITRLVGQKPILLGPSLYDRLPVNVLNSNEIGTDLVSNAVAAFVEYGGPTMVVDFGTALTFTTIDQSGRILGVAIAPGLFTALKSLTGNAAQLFDVPLETPPSVLGENTVHAIQSGIVYGFSGLVDSIVLRTEKELGIPLNVVATGGLSFVLRGVSTRIKTVDADLTLKGLLFIALNV
jgi:type III pantothenate kinase